MASILVVDDEEIMRKAVRAALIKGGHAVTVARNGQEALSWVQTEFFELIVTDANMPTVLLMKIESLLNKAKIA